jgi:hypothetical protein
MNAEVKENLMRRALGMVYGGDVENMKKFKKKNVKS